MSAKLMRVDRIGSMLKGAAVVAFSALADCLTLHGAAAQAAYHRPPLVVAPMLEGIFTCEQAAGEKSVTSLQGAFEYCADHNFNAASLIERALNDLQPVGLKGRGLVGYMAPLPLLSLWKQNGGSWEIDTKKVDLYVDLIEKIDRPVVVYLAADHFDTSGPISAYLAKDKENLELLASGEPPSSGYFGQTICLIRFGQMRRSPLIAIDLKHCAM